ncbi:hypothetical protein BDF14DRAFT_1744118 [Spinellus fusiger]|nr:hypothetical protein BDF14DRAFT_1744118 [Spinellus fusiger]
MLRHWLSTWLSPQQNENYQYDCKEDTEEDWIQVSPMDQQTHTSLSMPKEASLANGVSHASSHQVSTDLPRLKHKNIGKSVPVSPTDAATEINTDTTPVTEIKAKTATTMAAPMAAPVATPVATPMVTPKLRLSSSSSIESSAKGLSRQERRHKERMALKEKKHHNRNVPCRTQATVSHCLSASRSMSIEC